MCEIPTTLFRKPRGMRDRGIKNHLSFWETRKSACPRQGKLGKLGRKRHFLKTWGRGRRSGSFVVRDTF